MDIDCQFNGDGCGANEKQIANEKDGREMKMQSLSDEGHESTASLSKSTSKQESECGSTDSDQYDSIINEEYIADDIGSIPNTGTKINYYSLYKQRIRKGLNQTDYNNIQIGFNSVGIEKISNNKCYDYIQENRRMILIRPLDKYVFDSTDPDEIKRQSDDFRFHSRYGAAIVIKKPHKLRINCLAIDLEAIEFFLKQVTPNSRIIFDNVEMKRKDKEHQKEIDKIQNIVLKTVNCKIKKLTFNAKNAIISDENMLKCGYFML